MKLEHAYPEYKKGKNKMAEQHNTIKEQEQMNQLYHWILKSTYEDFPAELVTYAKTLILDVLLTRK